MSGIFISYRRSTSKDLARSIFLALKARNYDVFFDVNSIDSGEFDRIILNQIAARPHFLLVISRGSLERCAQSGDWLGREIDEALQLKRNIIPVYDEGFSIEDEKNYLPQPARDILPRLNAPPYHHYYFEAFIDTICKRFLKQPIYDVVLTPTPDIELTEVQKRIELATREADIPNSVQFPESGSNILPPPFDWVHIPEGKVKIASTIIEDARSYFGYSSITENKPKTRSVKTFDISKYPITNQQFHMFVDSGGYETRNYWSELGWKYREETPWDEPIGWKNLYAKKPAHPVVGLSWYEATAFCDWLSKTSGTRITLASEEQWQRAGQGDTNQEYPWGDIFITKYATYDRHLPGFSMQGTRGYNINPSPSKKATGTTAVDNYKSEVGSLFGVFDLSGNVWEWTLSKSELDNEDGITKTYLMYIIRGGSWKSEDEDELSLKFRYRIDPLERRDDVGFRIVRT